MGALCAHYLTLRPKCQLLKEFSELVLPKKRLRMKKVKVPELVLLYSQKTTLYVCEGFPWVVQGWWYPSPYLHQEACLGVLGGLFTCVLWYTYSIHCFQNKDYGTHQTDLISVLSAQRAGLHLGFKGYLWATKWMSPFTRVFFERVCQKWRTDFLLDVQGQRGATHTEWPSW